MDLRIRMPPPLPTILFFHEPPPGARTAESARTGNWQCTDSAVRAPAAGWLLVPLCGFEIVEATHEPERRSPDRLDSHFRRNEPIGRSAFRGSRSQCAIRKSWRLPTNRNASSARPSLPFGMEARVAAGRERRGFEVLGFKARITIGRAGARGIWTERLFSRTRSFLRQAEREQWSRCSRVSVQFRCVGAPIITVIIAAVPSFVYMTPAQP